eukprot:scaffold4675_cov378-Prasinococcus_capsulatus_cf.AAC.7
MWQRSTPFLCSTSAARKQAAAHPATERMCARVHGVKRSETAPNGTAPSWPTGMVDEQGRSDSRLGG